MKIKEMQTPMRPREKALAWGLETLSDYELIMLLIGSGTKNRTVDVIASDLLAASQDLGRLYDMSLQDLMQISGISQVKALQMLGSIELCRRALKKKAYGAVIHSPKDLAEWFEMEYGTRKQEHVIAVFLDVHLRIVSHKVIFVGTLSSSAIHPREIFREAFRQCANSLMLVHNHPSNCVQPSLEDLDVTKQIAKVGEIMGIALQDHVIVCTDTCYSFKEHGLM